MLELELSTTSKSLAFEQELAQFGPSQTTSTPLQQSLAYCTRCAKRHYENFVVASCLLPRPLRQDFHNIYAFCRWADDLADEIRDPQTSLSLLDWWQAELEQCIDGTPRHPVLVALQQTICRHNMSLTPFVDLLSAFRQDQTVTRYQDDAQLFDYCRRSANPVGRMLLQLAKRSDPESLRLSDCVCSGLQLANFCQDMARDAALGRIYLPQSRWPAARVDEAMLLQVHATPQMKNALSQWVPTAREQLLAGWPLIDRVPRWLRVDVDLFVRGGLAILDAIADQQFDVWTKRPTVGKWTQAKLLGKTLCQPSRQTKLRASQRWCTDVCSESRSSFIAAFSLVEPARRRGMQALYAFARLTDDIGDEPGHSPAQRQHRLNHWRQQLWLKCQPGALPADIASTHSSSTIDISSMIEEHHQLWPTLVNCVQQYQIPVQLLDDIVQGVALDLNHQQPSDWQELQHYCSLVASSVGLACIHIWREPQSTNPVPIEAAMACGFAFQLTNILRDIGEDARLGRIYIPRELFEQYQVDRQAWLELRPTGQWQTMLDELGQRAEALYQQGWPTITALSPRSQRLFSLMWRSYHSLLKPILSDKPRLWETAKVRLRKRQRLALLTSHYLSPMRRILAQRPLIIK